jgi:hypothetical protein
MQAPLIARGRHNDSIASLPDFLTCLLIGINVAVFLLQMMIPQGHLLRAGESDVRYSCAKVQTACTQNQNLKFNQRAYMLQEDALVGLFLRQPWCSPDGEHPRELPVDINRYPGTDSHVQRLKNVKIFFLSAAFRW